MDKDQTKLYSNLLIDTKFNIVSFNEHSAFIIKSLMNIDLRKGMSLFDIIQDEFKKSSLEIFDKVFKGEFLRKEFHFISEKGEDFYFEYIYNPIFDTKNKVRYASISAVDVTQNKITQFALLESEKRLRGFLDLQSSFLIRVDSRGVFTFANEAFCHKFGKKNDDIIGKVYNLFIHPDDLINSNNAMNNIELPPYRSIIEQRVMTVDGWRWIHWENIAIKDEKNETVEIQSVGRDITDLKESIKSLSETNELLNGILSSSPLGIVVIDFKGNVKFWSQGSERMFQWNSLEVLGKFNPTIKADDIDSYNSKCLRIFSGENITESNVEKFRKDGSLILVDISGVPLKDSNDKVFAGLIIYQDVTSKVKTELENLKLSSAFNLSSAAIAMLNENLEVEFINKRFSDLTGYSYDDVKGKNLKDIKPPQMTNDEYLKILNAIKEGSEWRSEQINVTKSGNLYWENVLIYPVCSINGKIKNYLLIKEDISENKQAMQELVNTRLRLGTILNNFPNIVLYEFGGKNPFISPNVQNVLGYNPEIFIREKNFLESIIIKEDISEYLNAFNSWNAGQGNEIFKINFRCRNAENKIIWIENIISKVYDGNNFYYCGVLQDVTDFKEIEDTIIWNETLLRIMTDSTRFGYYVTNKKEDNVLYVNEKFCEFWNISDLYEKLRNKKIKSSEILQKCSEYVMDSEIFLQTTNKYNNPENQITFEDEINMKNGRTLRRFSSLLNNSKGEYIGRFYLYEDITEKKFFDKIHKSQSDYKTIIEQSIDAVILFDAKGMINAANKIASELLGYTRNEFQSMNVIDIFDTSDPYYEDVKFLEVMEGKTILSKRKLIKKDGTRIFVEIHSKMLRNRLIQSVIWDIGKSGYDAYLGKYESIINPYVNLLYKLKAFKHGENSLNCLNRISLFFKNYKYLFTSSEKKEKKEYEIEKRFLDLIDEYNNSVNSQIEYIISIINRLISDLPKSSMYDDLIKSVDSLDIHSKHLYSKLLKIKDSLRIKFIQNKPVNDVEDLVDSIHKIKSSFKLITKLFNDNFISDLDSVIHNLINHYNSLNSKLRVEYKDNSNSNKIVFNKGELFDAIKIFFDNTIEAYGNAESKEKQYRIRIEINQASDDLILSFKDYGPGISESIKSSIFRKGVSTKGLNRGFGLSYSNTLIQKYGGKFYLDKDFQEGAKFNLIFKII